jgi:hypothetical protein
MEFTAWFGKVKGPIENIIEHRPEVYQPLDILPCKALIIPSSGAKA